MGFIGDFFLGNALTKLTNLMVELDFYRERLPIGLGGGIDSLPPSRQEQMTKKSNAWLATLRRSPAGRITGALLMSMETSRRMGNIHRLRAQERLLGILVSEGIAMDPERLATLIQAKERLDTRHPTSSLSTLSPSINRKSDPGDFVVTPLLPNIIGMRPSAGYLAGRIMTLVFIDPKPTEAPVNAPPMVRYHFAATQYDSEKESMVRLLTLETIFGPPMLCTFERDGTHQTIGEGDRFITLSAFSEMAKREACKEAFIPVDKAIALET